jgi:hypothetical protein
MKLLPHPSESHGKGLTPVCSTSCFFSWFFFLNSAPHPSTLHAYGIGLEGDSDVGNRTDQTVSQNELGVGIRHQSGGVRCGAVWCYTVQHAAVVSTLAEARHGQTVKEKKKDEPVLLEMPFHVVPCEERHCASVCCAWHILCPRVCCRVFDQMGLSGTGTHVARAGGCRRRRA